jgi:hypothetical protein
VQVANLGNPSTGDVEIRILKPISVRPPEYFVFQQRILRNLYLSAQLPKLTSKLSVTSGINPEALRRKDVATLRQFECRKVIDFNDFDINTAQSHLLHLHRQGEHGR